MQSHSFMSGLFYQIKTKLSYLGMFSFEIGICEEENGTIIEFFCNSNHLELIFVNWMLCVLLVCTMQYDNKLIDEEFQSHQYEMSASSSRGSAPTACIISYFFSAAAKFSNEWTLCESRDGGQILITKSWVISFWKLMNWSTIFFISRRLF